jgi:aspartokinase-like uncharacterized kinase
MKVIKLGGSLMSDMGTLRQCLKTIEQKYSSNTVIVPGGGVFAEQVRTVQRQWDVSDEYAHQMAILAMKQVALLLKNIEPCFELIESIDLLQQKNLKHSITIWSPCVQELLVPEIKESWAVTSDSLAAWLATQLSAEELILVKSANISIQTDIQKMQKEGVLDKAFDKFIKHANYKIFLINKQKFNEYIPS